MSTPTFPFTTKAILVEQPLYQFFAAVVPANVLLSVAFSDAMQAKIKADGVGYTVEATQRIMQSKRLAQIARYIDREDSGFPNTIILAANYRQDGLIEEDEPLDEENAGNMPAIISKRWSVIEDECGGYTLTIPTAEKLAAVIDGQHRLFAFAETDRPERLDMNLLCSVFLDLPKPYQAQLFATINSTQKPVDKSLTYELFGYNIDEEEPQYWSPDKLAVFLTRKLGTENGSPLKGRIVIAPQKDEALKEISGQGNWRVSTAVVVEGIMRLFSSNPKRDTQLMLTPTRNTREVLQEGPKDKSVLRTYYIEANDNLIYTLVLNYLKACDAVFWSKAPANSFIVRTVGVQALFDLLRRVFAAAALKEKNVKQEFFQDYLSRAADIDFSADAYKNASGSGRSIIRRALEDAIGSVA
ncbi:DNA phosphorothioation-associated DGQHR protein 1 [Neoaquamicrobium sediminum]|uniref:DNA phosphorothioation-associated DGQHR protein 1 n=1 Tax=Neoaquamicrobium sediminum TaxID=1849104 RepID=UPI00156333BA|nr:DNA phosphorothioation-associated DGQHR protein 1 [Mesorhizobium sediminum]NRC56543.1 DGQHR domain-containing protein [Mesorhizobium sediminum]